MFDTLSELRRRIEQLERLPEALAREADLQLPENYPSTGLVRVYNVGGFGDVPRCGVMCVTEPFYDPVTQFAEVAKRPPPTLGVFPDVENGRHPFRFCVTLEAIPELSWGLAIVSGLTPVRLLVSSDPTVTHADISHGQTGYLESSPDRRQGSAWIVWKENYETTGLMWAIVRISNPTEPTPGCGGKPLQDLFDDSTGVNLLDHIMDHGCGWFAMAGTTNLTLTNLGTCEAPTATGTRVYANASTPRSTVEVHFIAGNTSDGNAIVLTAITRVVNTDNYWFCNAVILTDDDGHLDLKSNTGGSVTTRATVTGLTTPLGAEYLITISDSGPTVAAALTGPGVTADCSFASTLHSGGLGVGFGTESAGTYGTTTKIKTFTAV